MTSHLEGAAGAIGALEDDLRRRMYLFIRGEGRPVSRREAARRVGISPKLAAFHLDKLVEKGLLRAHYARPPGRSGPGAGRSSKLYEPAEEEVSVSLPPRAYELMGEVLLAALEERRPDESAEESARRVALEAGLELGRRAHAAAGPGGTRAAERALAEQGFEPYAAEGGLRLRNCPFHALSRKSPELVCGLNQALVDGLLDGLDDRGLEAVLDPRPGECCVHLRPSSAEEEAAHDGHEREE